MTGKIIIDISSEKIAWDTLTKVLSNEINCENYQLSFDNADWAVFKLYIKGQKFEHSLTPSTMKALIDLQKSLYHSIGIILHDDDNINKFKVAEKELYELAFKVDGGSSDISADGKETLVSVVSAIGGKMVGAMSQRQIFILCLTMAVLYFTQTPILKYVEGISDDRKAEIQAEKDKGMTDLIKQISKDQKDNIETISKVLKASPRARDVAEHVNDATSSILNGVSSADSIRLQGVEMDKAVVASINKRTRRPSENVAIQENFYVLSVDTSDPDITKVSLQEVSGEQRQLIAEIDDPLVFQKAKKAIQKGEWERVPIRVKLSAKKIGDDIKYAKIISANKLKTK